MNDKESIIAAIKGSSVVFAVTNYWEKMSAEIEIEQGKVMADASKAAGVERFFWSSLPNVSKGMRISLKTIQSISNHLQKPMANSPLSTISTAKPRSKSMFDPSACQQPS